MTERSGWAELPRDVVQHLMLHLKTREFYTLRLVSRNWASCSSQITLPPMVIPASQASLSVKIATLASWRQGGRFVDSDFSFQMDKPMSMLELRKTTKALIQGCLTSCQILAELQYGPSLHNDLYKERQQTANADQTADFAQQLLDENRIELRITMPGRSTGGTLPSPQAIKALKRFLDFDTYSIPAEQPAAGLPDTQHDDLNDFSCGLKHVTALKDSKTQVCTALVYGNEDDYPDPPLPYDEEVIAPVATLTHLTKLHLSLTDDYYPYTAIDFEPLACLTVLKDLALQYCDDPGYYGHRECDLVCCQGVLASNQHTLQFVTLTGPWTVATYNILQECPKLEILSISISGLSVEQAQALASISADSFRLTLERQLETDVLAAMKHSQPQIHKLTAWGMYQNEALRLPELLSLQELTLVNFVPFIVLERSVATGVAADSQGYCPVTGEGFEYCPMVTQLTFVDCPSISTQGLNHVIKEAMPALQTLSIQATKKPRKRMEVLGRCAPTVKFDANSLHDLCLGSCLRSIDLRGVSGLTAEAVSQFRLALHLRQCQGDAPSSIELLLPHAACLNKAVFTLSTKRSLFLPNIFETSDCGDAEQILCRSPTALV